MPILTLEEFEQSTTQPPQRAASPDPIAASGVIAGTEKQKSPFSKEQKDAAGFAIRMEQNMKVMDDLMDSGYNPVDPTRLGTLKDNIVDNAPFIPDFLENVLVSGNYQLYRNAAMDFAMAQLRRESGAAITESEMDSMKELYIPAFGDAPETMAGKRARRKTAYEAMKASADKAYSQTKSQIKKGADPTLTEEEALDVLRERAKRNPELRAKLKARGLL